MLNKKLVMGGAFIGMLGLGVTGTAFAAEDDYVTIEKQPSSEVVVRGNLGDTDPTDPETPLPEGDNRWIKVTVPTAVVFYSNPDDTNKITSPDYTITNKSGRPVKVDVANYQISGSVNGLKQLNLTRDSKGFDGKENIELAKDNVSTLSTATELVRLANNKGHFGANETGQDMSTSFTFTGDINESELKEDKNYVESNLTFKFTALRLDGKTVEENDGQNN